MHTLLRIWLHFTKHAKIYKNTESDHGKYAWLPIEARNFWRRLQPTNCVEHGRHPFAFCGAGGRNILIYSESNVISALQTKQQNKAHQLTCVVLALVATEVCTHQGNRCGTGMTAEL